MGIPDYDFKTIFRFKEEKLRPIKEYKNLTKKELLSEAREIQHCLWLTDDSKFRYLDMLRDAPSPYIGIQECESSVAKCRKDLETLNKYKVAIAIEWYGRKGIVYKEDK